MPLQSNALWPLDRNWQLADRKQRINIFLTMLAISICLTDSQSDGYFRKMDLHLHILISAYTAYFVYTYVCRAFG